MKNKTILCYLLAAVPLATVSPFAAAEIRNGQKPNAAVVLNLAHLSAINDLPVQTNLPDPLLLADGRKVTTVAQWQERRAEMKHIIEYYAIGDSPPPPGNVTGHELFSLALGHGAVDCRLVHLSFGPEKKLGFDLAIFIPKQATVGHAPLPVIVQPVFAPLPGTNDVTTNTWVIAAQQYAEPLRRGYAIAAFYYQQCGADSTNYQATGFFPAYPGYDWGDLAAWAWGMSRCVDFLETQPFVDRSKIIALGHSRLGKATLIAGAFDDRFALVAPAGSGCAGTGAYRFCGKGRGGKEGLEDAVKRFPQWFGPRLSGFSGQVEKLPFDEHWLIALVAPRCFIAADGLGDPYCNGNALAQSYRMAKPVYEFLGVPEHLGVHFRPGKHLLASADWEAILDFADQQLRKLPVNEHFDRLPPAEELH